MLECFSDKFEESKETFKAAIDIYKENGKLEVAALLEAHANSVGAQIPEDLDQEQYSQRRLETAEAIDTIATGESDEEEPV